jgi:hypothetical protein
MRNTFAIVGIILLMACAATGVARHVNDPPLRGIVETEGRSVRALRTGPAVIHAYSAFRGGDLYTVPLIDGTDADCVAQASPNGSPESELVEANRRMTIWVPDGELACLATDTRGSFELLWHANVDAPVDTSAIAAMPNAGQRR